jgi:anthranilate phosphoribosyltransferase
MDEISIAAKTTVFQIESNEITKFEIDPKEYKLYHPSIDDISGGSPIENAAIIRSVLDGDEGSARDIVILNAGFALYVANKVTAPKLGIIAATESIDEGKAKQTLEDLIIETNRYE